MSDYTEQDLQKAYDEGYEDAMRIAESRLEVDLEDAQQQAYEDGYGEGYSAAVSDFEPEGF